MTFFLSGIVKDTFIRTNTAIIEGLFKKCNREEDLNKTFPCVSLKAACKSLWTQMLLLHSSVWWIIRVPPNGILLLHWICMRNRGHIRKRSDAQTNQGQWTEHRNMQGPTRFCAEKPDWVNQRSKGLPQGLSLFFSFVCLSLWFSHLLFFFSQPKTNQVFRLALPPPSACHLGDEGMSESCGEEREKSWIRGKEIPSRGKGEYRHSWGVNCYNPSLSFHPSGTESKMPPGRYDPETETHTHTKHRRVRAYEKHSSAPERAG